jgi:hypothetical protein
MEWASRKQGIRKGKISLLFMNMRYPGRCPKLRQLGGCLNRRDEWEELDLPKMVLEVNKALAFSSGACALDLFMLYSINGGCGVFGDAISKVGLGYSSDT